MGDDKLEFSGIVEVVSRHAGALAGAAARVGRSIKLSVGGTGVIGEGPSSQIAEKPVRARPKKKKRITTKKKKQKDSEAKIEEEESEKNQEIEPLPESPETEQV